MPSHEPPFDFDKAQPIRGKSATATRPKKKKRRRKIRKQFIIAVAVSLALLIGVISLTVWGISSLVHFVKNLPEKEPPVSDTLVEDTNTHEMPSGDLVDNPPDLELEPPFVVTRTANTVTLGEDFPSEFVIVIDAESGEVLAQRKSDAVISPASMTKILTLLVAVENISDWDATFTMTREITDYCFVNDCSIVGYMVDEVIPVRELLYGCIMSSGADACLALANVACGSHEAFVAKMNEKLEELGLSDTAHFTNCVGLYDKEHHCTVEDMALLMRAVLKNETCREVMAARIFKTAPTTEHPEGQDLSNWFIRRIEDKELGDITVKGAKTGFVNESGCCAVSYGERSDGHGYYVVTGNAYSQWRSIYDHADLYARFCQGS